MEHERDLLHAFLEELLPELEQDVRAALAAAKEPGNDFGRRAAFRAVFASIEAAVFALKQLVLAGLDAQRHRYTGAEVAILREEDYDLDDSGRAVERRRHLHFEANLRFAFQMVVREADLEVQADWSSVGWRSLKESLAVRNRITHPRRSEALQISSQELEALEKGYAWFQISIARTLANALLAARLKNYRLSNQLFTKPLLRLLDSTDPDATSATVDQEALGEIGGAREMLLRFGFLEERGDSLLLTLRAKDYVRWRRREGLAPDAAGLTDETL